jgi:hypothetical protein
MTNIVDIVEGSRFYTDESWALLLRRLVTETTLSLRREYTLPAARFLATLDIQNKTTSDAGVEKWGFSELLHRLSALPETKILRVEEFDVEAFAVRCVFDGDSTTLHGCTIVKKGRKAMQTPPAWDGSLDALERFNNEPEE